jgi:tetratricopeptide (TPR) repeat protein
MIRIPQAVVALSVAVAVLLGLVACGDSSSVEEHFQQGNEYAQAGEFEKAITEFEAVLQIDPDNVSAMSNLGVVYYNLGRLDEAIQQYQEAIARAPDDADIHSNLAAAFVQKGQLDKALQEYESAVQINPELAEAHFGLGVVFQQTGKVDEAIAAFERFQALDTGSDAMATDLAKQYLERLKGE